MPYCGFLLDQATWKERYAPQMFQNARRAMFWVWVGENYLERLSEGLEAIYGAVGEEGCQPTSTGVPVPSDSTLPSCCLRLTGVGLSLVCFYCATILAPFHLANTPDSGPDVRARSRLSNGPALHVAIS